MLASAVPRDLVALYSRVFSWFFRDGHRLCEGSARPVRLHGRGDISGNELPEHPIHRFFVGLSGLFQCSSKTGIEGDIHLVGRTVTGSQRIPIHIGKKVLKTVDLVTLKRGGEIRG
jgi:hypothetical protein